jgi:predicted phosphodiesterase
LRLYKKTVYFTPTNLARGEIVGALNRQWYGDKLWVLLNKKVAELQEIFPDYAKESLKSKQKLYRRKIREGKEVEAPMPSWYNESYTHAQIRAKLEGNPALETAQIEDVLVDNKARKYLHDLLDKTIDETNINPEHINKLRITAGSHEGYIKNADNEIEYTKSLRKGSISLMLEPEKFKPQWTPIHQPLADIFPVKETTAVSKKGLKTCVILPDPQIGFRKFVDGSTDPFHDDNAISIALQVIRDLKPDKVVCLGDFLDLPGFGKYEQTEDYAHTTQLAIDYGYRLLAMIKAIVPKAEIVVIEGNHDRRIEKSIRTNNMYAFGIKRADDITGWPVFSVPYLLGFDKLGVEYVEGYPAGKYWINENLQCIHGHIVRQPGATAAAVVRAETVSTIFGHIHRIETAYDTQNIYQGARANLAHSPGTLCRIDGGVPSVKGSTRLDGRPVKSFENWQHGLAIVDYKDGNAPFSLHSVYINTHRNYETTVHGKIYTPDKQIIKQLNGK